MCADDMPKQRKRNPKICLVNCQWENCQWQLDIEPSEYDIFSDHLKTHADEFISRSRSDPDWQEGQSFACCCMWRGCAWEGCGDFMELLRHIMCHGYHVLLKALGKLVQMKMKLATCRIEMEDPYNSLPTLSTYICQWNGCHTEYYCPNKFYRHVEKHALETTPLQDETTDLKMRCAWEICSNQFRDKYKLKEHIRVHTHEKLIACPDCGGMFANRTKLLDHLSRQNPEAYENFQCSHCSKRCPSERLLRDHMRHHVNFLKCPQCDMTCPNPGSLKYHIAYRHTDERPYSCAMCEQSFKSNSDLVRHEESHLEKSYICDVADCFYSTKTQHCLRRHIRVVHSNNEKRYVCHICNNAYSRGFGLTKHLKKKHNFSWPSGHPRFRYIQYEDGFYRLQMVRFESMELTKRLHGNNDDNEDEDVVPNGVTYDGEELSQYSGDNSGNKMVLLDSTGASYSGEQGDVGLGYSQGEMVVENEEKFAEKLLNDDILYTNVAFQIDTGTGVVKEEIEHREPQDEKSDFMFPTATSVNKEENENMIDSDASLRNLLMSRDIVLQPKPVGYEKSVMAQLLELSKKQQTDTSTVDSAIVSNLYQRLKVEMSKYKAQKSADAITVQPPEVAANEILVAEEKVPVSEGKDRKREREIELFVENESEKKLKLLDDYSIIEDDFTGETNFHELIKNATNEFDEDVNKEIVSRVLLSLNSDTN